MKLNCLVDYKYGQMPRVSSKQAKDYDLDPKAYHGGPVKVFEAGKEYEVEDTLAMRLLRDFGPKRGRRDVKFEPQDPRHMVALLAGDADKLTLNQVLAQGFVVGDTGGTEQQVDIEPAGVS